MRRAGGEPWVLDPAVDRADVVIRAAGGLLLTGGDDVRPDLYGAARTPSFDGPRPDATQYEIELCRRAIEADMPIFAICRGIQVLNVARGGTLVQDIPTERPLDRDRIVCRRPRMRPMRSRTPFRWKPIRSWRALRRAG